ncbi:MAG: hypothetical protein JW850_12440 [Thermoflexales bacterium]|nr:hypothetical protein [Thermoflexales bacterium]
MSQSAGQNDLAQLRQILADRFDEGELRTFCFDLQLDYDDLLGTSKLDKARELVAYCERHNQVYGIIDTGKRLRPDIDWDQVAVGLAAKE